MRAAGMTLIVCLGLASFAGAQGVKIAAKRGTERETRTKATLEQILSKYGLKKYTFTKDVVIEEGAINHAFPVLTLNGRFADAEDDLLSSYVHEQLHWHLRARQPQMQRAVSELRQMYPRVPVGGSDGAETEYSTYGHLVDCFLEIQADRQLLGPERTTAVIERKGHYTWIYRTVLHDEARIRALVERHGLEIK